MKKKTNERKNPSERKGNTGCSSAKKKPKRSTTLSNRKSKSSSKRRPKRKKTFRINLKKYWQIKVACALVAVVLLIVGMVQVNNYFSIPVSEGEYPIKGVDLSAYQGNVDWEVLSQQGIAFAFIKATEGSGHLDKKFKYNWEQAHKTDLYIGAYHFMSFETSGEDQAKNFIKNVKKKGNMLPPVVDVEFYGNFSTKNISANKVHSILTPLLDTLEKEYGVKPLIYTNSHLYELYISGQYDNDIWISDPNMNQPLSDGIKWTFCQYSFEGTMKGYSGNLKHIDLDVFNGGRRDFFKYCN